MMARDPSSSPRTRYEFIRRFTERDYDPFKDDYLKHLRELTRIIREIGEPLEGNVFFDHLESNLTEDNLSADYLPKRRSLAMLALTKSNVLEVGFNSGFSALLLLTANRNLRLSSVDHCSHGYARPCFEYLRNAFGDRICLHEGNSVEVLPRLSTNTAEYDAFVIDGAHDVSTAEADLDNVLNLGRRGSLICFDDSELPQLRVLINLHMLSGNLVSVVDSLGYIPNLHQMFFLNNKE